MWVCGEVKAGGQKVKQGRGGAAFQTVGSLKKKKAFQKRIRTLLFSSFPRSQPSFDVLFSCLILSLTAGSCRQHRKTSLYERGLICTFIVGNSPANIIKSAHICFLFMYLFCCLSLHLHQAKSTWLSFFFFLCCGEFSWLNSTERVNICNWF